MNTSLPMILVTGGAGFVGSNISLALRERYPDQQVVAFDNLMRKGSELNIPRLKAAGVVFINGDVRDQDALSKLKNVTLIIDCAAEPSVLAGSAGYGMQPRDVVDINLNGTINCLELARRTDASMIFISTNRIYPLERLNQLPFKELETRFDLADSVDTPGVSEKGVSESFPLQGRRTLYGATKLSSELMIQEYADICGIQFTINRCGILAGPWQFGTAEQGIIALWAARHLFQRELSYIGFGGTGKQVRDVLHVSDLIDAIFFQIDNLCTCSGKTFQIGGGTENSTSLLELTRICEVVTGNSINIQSVDETRQSDIKWYVTDYSFFNELSNWRPRKTLRNTVEDTVDWMRQHESRIAPLFRA